jgi:hypothetical protein
MEKPIIIQMEHICDDIEKFLSKNLISLQCTISVS